MNGGLHLVQRPSVGHRRRGRQPAASVDFQVYADGDARSPTRGVDDAARARPRRSRVDLTGHTTAAASSSPTAATATPTTTATGPTPRSPAGAPARRPTPPRRPSPATTPGDGATGVATSIAPVTAHVLRGDRSPPRSPRTDVHARRAGPARRPLAGDASPTTPRRNDGHARPRRAALAAVHRRTSPRLKGGPPAGSTGPRRQPPRRRRHAGRFTTARAEPPPSTYLLRLSP